jgi:hypothetical protein
MAGVSSKEIQTLAGHKTITMAARHAHLWPDAAASAFERMLTHARAWASMHQNRNRKEEVIGGQSLGWASIRLFS